jgi:hypothetical protein
MNDKQTIQLMLDALLKKNGKWGQGHDELEAKAIAAGREALAQPTSGDYAMGYAEGFNDACKPAQPEQVKTNIPPVFKEAQRVVKEQYKHYYEVMGRDTAQPEQTGFECPDCDGSHFCTRKRCNEAQPEQVKPYQRELTGQERDVLMSATYGSSKVIDKGFMAQPEQEPNSVHRTTDKKLELFYSITKGMQPEQREMKTSDFPAVVAAKEATLKQVEFYNEMMDEQPEQDCHATGVCVRSGLYVAAQPEQEPLTDEDIKTMYLRAHDNNMYMGWLAVAVAFARAIEAKLKEKNK